MFQLYADKTANNSFSRIVENVLNPNWKSWVDVHACPCHTQTLLLNVFVSSNEPASDEHAVHTGLTMTIYLQYAVAAVATSWRYFDL